MADPRRTTRKPGRPAQGRTSPAAAARSAEAAARRAERRGELRARAKAAAETQHRTRLTNRAAVLVLVLAVLAVSYASSLRAYLRQHSDMAATTSSISASTSKLAELNREKERSNDPAYIVQEARKAGYVMKGEKPYVVVDHGKPLDATSKLSDPSTVNHPDEPTWYSTAWESMKIAGNPPTKVPAPSDEISAPRTDDKGAQ